mmetsp:Transcript_37049/g.45780  ORF Transcript_37049/g.45780 Transcript_37049/m.45780 type:complete len:120 (-) Transcript_37049:90-449(-)
MPLEGNAEMIVWRQAVDTELRLAAQWEESWGFLKATPEEKERAKACLPKLKAKGIPGPELDEKKDHAADLSQLTPRPKGLFLATSQQSYSQRAPIEKLAMKRWATRHDPELWPTITPAK